MCVIGSPFEPDFVCVPVGSGVQPWLVLLRHHLICPFETVHSLNLELTQEASLTTEPQGSPHLRLLSSGIASTCHQLWLLFVWVLRIQLRFLRLRGKKSTG